MRFRKNAKGKIILKHRDGRDVAFQFEVDANEALRCRDNEGQCPYILPKSSVISVTDEMRENISKRIVEKKKQKEDMRRKSIRTTSGRNIPEEFLVDDDEVSLDEEFIQSNARDEIGEGDEAIDEMGFDDPEEPGDKVQDKKAIKTKGRKPSVKK